MSRSYRSSVPFLLALSGQLALAAPALPPDLSGLSAPLEASIQLPGSGVQMLQLQDRVAFLSANGRYAFTGDAWDLWHGTRLESVAQAQELAGRVDLNRLGLNPKDLGAILVGSAQSGTNPAWVFIDPLCPACQELIDRLAHTESPAHVIPLPLGSADSAQAARRLLCAPSPEAARSALLDQSWSELPAPGAGCDTQPLIRALITARLLGIDSVPTLIAPDGRIQRGLPDELSAWLAGEQP
jgi:thiol:disulfide interchange protein DsbC